MRILLFVLLLVFSLDGFSQKDLKKLRTASWEAFVYKISAAETEQYMKWDSIPMERFEEAVPFLVFPADSIDESKLPVGNYMVIRARESYVQADVLNISDLRLITINNRYRVQLDARNKAGEPVEQVRMFVDNKEIKADPSSRTFWLKNRKKEEAVIKVYTVTDTLYTAVELDDDNYIKPVPQQIRDNYRRTKIYRVLNWVPGQFNRLFSAKKERRYLFTKGYMILNQPKYKLGDTVKFKAYLLDQRSKQYKKALDVYIDYYHQGRQVEQLITKLKPATPGAYFSQFVLRDTLISGIRYNLSFRNRKGKKLVNGDLKVEDYVLDDINSTSFRSEKENYYRDDTLRFFASAKDANGLNVLDADVELLLETSGINDTYQDTLFVRDTLYRLRTKLAANGDTKFVVPAAILPKANVSIRATVRFINSNNEVQEKTQTFMYQYFSREIFAKQKNDSVYVAYLENGVSVPAAGTMQADDEKAETVNFPATIRINGLSESYQFQYKAGDILFSETFRPSPYLVGLYRISSGDTLGFVLDNPYQVPVYYTVLDGQKIIATGRQSDKNISWQKIMSDNRQYYSVRWQYMWNGEEKKEQTSIGLFYKALAVKIDAKNKIFPGEKDSIRVNVSDYKGRPAADVNLTSVGYNNQLSKDIKIKEPSYDVRYRGKKYIDYPPFKETELDLPFSSDLLARNKKWIKKFGLDSMLYYQLMFPQNGFKDVTTLLGDFIPQVSVSLVKDGLLQEIYLLHINRQFRYYNAVTDTNRYAFEVYPGYAQFVIRTKDQEIKLDSIYIQPGFKHDLVFDLDALPANSKIKNVDPYWSKDEIQLLENSIWRLRGRNMPGAYVWQGRNISVLNGNDLHILGPFETDSLYFFDSSKFDIAFRFEPGYEYSLSKKVTRLEKRKLFASQEDKIYLPVVRYPNLKLGDTLVFPPVIRYAPEKIFPVSRNLKTTHGFWYDFHRAATGKLMIKVPRDSTIKYFILKHADSIQAIVISNMYNSTIFNLDPGKYRLLLVTWNNVTAEKNVTISANGTLVADMRHTVFLTGNTLLEQLYTDAARQEELARQKEEEPLTLVEKPVSLMPSAMIVSKNGGATLTVNVIDGKSGGPIPFAVITFAGYKPSVITDAQGNYSLPNLKKGNYTLVISAVGYMEKRVALDIVNESPVKINVSLLISRQALEEVVVTSLGVQRQRRDMGYATAVITSNELYRPVNVAQGLQGKVSGLNITSIDNGVFEDAKINLRGIRSLSGNSDPLLIVDGIITPLSVLASINPEEILEVVTLTGASSSAIYGSEAANGAIVVTTKRKTDRKVFRDYAFWQPNMITDKNGNASFEIVYPDNITGWKNYVFAMDKKSRVGKTYLLTQSFKPMVAQLNMPLFLTEGDSSYVIGKASNYTEDKYSISTSFKLNGQSLSENNTDLSPSDAHIDQQLISTSGRDTLSIGYELRSTTGFKDGEERKLPVLKKGTEETVGDFWVLLKDTTVNFRLSPDAAGLNIYAQNNTLDVLLDELEHLENYPHQCMEQTTSKLKGLALKKQIYQLLKKDFTEQKLADQLLAKIQKAQLYDGGWSWWPNGKANFEVTNYILQVLLSYRSNPLVETNIRNGFLYLQNQLPSLKKDRLMAALYTLSEGHHEMNFETFLQKINADSIAMYGKWQKLRIMQRQKIEHTALLEELMNKKKLSMLGGIHWGEQTYNWSNNEIATTVLAYNVLKEERGFERATGGIIQYFLERRRSGYWRNTVESASIVGAILQDAMDARNDITKPATVSVSGDTMFTINKFPFEMKWRSTDIKNLNFDKRGNGIVYLTANRKIFLTDPAPVTDNFIINTYFSKSGQRQQVLKSGEKIKMIVEVNVLKESEYVMLEVPIPAGCIYSDKDNQNWYEYREVSKDKVMIFKEFLGKGIQTFEIELAPRYNGLYNINPAKAELMYYPTFFGRNEMKKVSIKP